MWYEFKQFMQRSFHLGIKEKRREAFWELHRLIYELNSFEKEYKKASP